MQSEVMKTFVQDSYLFVYDRRQYISKRIKNCRPAEHVAERDESIYRNCLWDVGIYCEHFQVNES